MNYPDNNPKTALGILKVPLHLVPPSAKHYLALAFKDGAAKYGPYNWRDKTVSSSVYVAAAARHMDAWWDGEEVSSDAKVHHLAHAMACLAIILDAQTVGKLNDDRPTQGAASQLQLDFAAPVQPAKVEPLQLEFDFKEPTVEQIVLGPVIRKLEELAAVAQDKHYQAYNAGTIGSPVREGYSGFLGPDQDPVEQRGLPDVQKNLRAEDAVINITSRAFG